MLINHLSLTNFRNIADMELRFGESFNYVFGDNGAGKTAILESIGFLARGRSFRTSKTNALINEHADSFLLTGELQDDVVRSVGVQRTRSEGVAVSVDGVRSSRVSDLARYLPVQVLLPDSSNLIYGAPGIRREFIDWGLFHVEPAFLGVARRYRRVVQQRNAWLKDQNTVNDILEDPWFEQYTSLALQLTRMRGEYVAQLAPCCASLLAELAPELSISLGYQSGGLDVVNEGSGQYLGEDSFGGDLQAAALKKMSESFARDVKFGLTHRGPHRADLIITFRGASAAETASRGQAKVIASAAYLAQAVLQEQLQGTKSVFLIDDFGAELDTDHWQRFYNQLVKLQCQVIVTSTESPRDRSEWASGSECELFHVKHGGIAPV